MKKIGRFGHKRYAQILAQVMAGPVTIADAMAVQKVQIQTIREILWRFERLGLVRVCEWQEPKARSSFMVPVFAADGLPSLPYPRKINRAPFGTTKGRPRSELSAFAHVVRCLKAGATRMDIHEQTGLAYMRVSQLVREMRRLKMLHICDWKVRPDHSGKPAEVLMFGPGVNDPKPVTMTRAEIERRHRQKRKGMEMNRKMIAATAANAGSWADVA